jgi:hypothetical protein
MAVRRVSAEAPAEHEAATVHLRRADGLDLEIAGSGSFVTATLERLLLALGVVAPPPG